MSRDNAPIRSFIVNMNESDGCCFSEIQEMYSRQCISYCKWFEGLGDKELPCGGNLNKRPERCPLIPVREARTPYDLIIAEKWVKE